MTNSIKPFRRKSLNTLKLNGVYPCPVCRQGQVSALTLMDTFACDFCQHIFTPNLEKQSLKMVDGQMPLTWRWTGRTWKGIRQVGVELGWMSVVVAIAFVIFPPSLIGLSAYLFPATSEDSFQWFPIVWTGITFLCHFACVLWLVVEYYQFPVRLYLRSLGRRWVSRFTG